ncbi:1,4-alpha-glucan branching protein GlgB [Pseudoponticoccus marisrubri]|uniref:1,4-alpha-glucan branching enzyme GlgB n=1 Tax=Pseudoponticoccus marisrubri TaxID=1685382 RepID=A0A0W7WKX6_9RHOB|nr:1,4-alpha-glucan branching protein GlgB [Pseudoponticoccus marisrubri]KUF11277.1 glycogen-branching enzyme [Pseudoponticoccus marisrubri]
MTTADLPPHLTQEDIALLKEARHPAPFDALGKHVVKRKAYVTAMVPDAITLEAIAGRKTVEVPRLDGPVFGGQIPNSKAGYKLRATFGGGRTWTFDDPYRFSPVLGEMDEYLIGEGTHRRLWDVLGAHVTEIDGVAGTHFAVWAPNAVRVSVVGDFNVWDGRRHPMRSRGTTGVWELFVPGIEEGALYKYEIAPQHGAPFLKADPVAFGAQHPPETSSVVRDITGYGWEDDAWMQSRATRHRRDKPISVYEVHLGSWRRNVEEDRPLSYRELATELVDYAVEMGFTHLEFLPVSEFPFDGSWGYQPVGLYAPTIRFGPPHEFRDLVEAAHKAGLGVILDWVPGHFPSDAHGLAQFDGTHLYEHSDPREGFHQDWNTLIYNYGRTEVKNFLTANALYWLEEYHVDGLRVDAVASMLYRDYSRQDGQWIPNRDGGRENYEAIDFLKEMNTVTYGAHEGIMTIAEESTAFPGVSTPVDAGGLGFGFKWNMGWMNDTLRYIEKDPIYRQYDHHLMTFGIDYAFTENFILPISHDEVVHGKGSMLSKMPGNDWEKFANLRAYYGFMWGHPGKKLLFMGCEFAQWGEWNHNVSLDWDALQGENHRGIQALVRDLNALYTATPALHARDCDPSGFRWIGNDPQHSMSSFMRFGEEGDAPVLVVCNFTPVDRHGVRVGVPMPGTWVEVMNTDAAAYGGGDRLNAAPLTTSSQGWDGLEQSIEIALPPLSVVMFQKQ